MNKCASVHLCKGAFMILSILKKAVPIPKIGKFDNFLFVGPHPDDIEVGCGGTVAKLVSMGKRVTFLIATDGCVGSLDPTLAEEEIVQIRQKESLESAAVLGVSDVRFLPYHDGGEYDRRAMLSDIIAAILDVRPQIVFCPDYTVPSECHPDHLTVGKVVTDAVFYSSWDKLTARFGQEGCVSDINIAYYFTHRPNSFVGVRKTRKLHMQALTCHKSQFSEETLRTFQSYFALRQLRFGFCSGKGRAEGYRVLGPTHQHCFPEASEIR